MPKEDENIRAHTPSLLEQAQAPPADTKYPPAIERDLALGRFMDAWSQLEAELRDLLSVLSGAPQQAAFSIAAAIPDMGRMKDLLLSLGALFIQDEHDRKELQEVCQGLVIYGRHRNSIVHGQWGLTNNRDRIMTGGIVHEHMWIRIYTMIDKQKEFKAAVGDDADAATQYVFTVRRLAERTGKVLKMADRVGALSNRIKALNTKV